jgi:4'-phosphopantetheinyl transferase
VEDQDPAIASAESEDLAQAAFYKDDSRRTQFLAGRGRVRTILAALLGLTPSSLEIELLPSGRPILSPRQNRDGYEWSLSHSGNYGILAVARGIKLGADLELIRARPRFREIANRYFGIQERAQIENEPSEEQALRIFYSIWTEKEALAKLQGGALGQHLGGAVPNGIAVQNGCWGSTIYSVAWQNPFHYSV